MSISSSTETRPYYNSFPVSLSKPHFTPSKGLHWKKIACVILGSVAVAQAKDSDSHTITSLDNTHFLTSLDNTHFLEKLIITIALGAIGGLIYGLCSSNPKKSQTTFKLADTKSSQTTERQSKTKESKENKERERDTSTLPTSELKREPPHESKRSTHVASLTSSTSTTLSSVLGTTKIDLKSLDPKKVFYSGSKKELLPQKELRKILNGYEIDQLMAMLGFAAKDYKTKFLDNLAIVKNELTSTKPKAQQNIEAYKELAKFFFNEQVVEMCLNGANMAIKSGNIKTLFALMCAASEDSWKEIAQKFKFVAPLLTILLAKISKSELDENFCVKKVGDTAEAMICQCTYFVGILDTEVIRHVKETRESKDKETDRSESEALVATNSQQVAASLL